MKPPSRRPLGNNRTSLTAMTGSAYGNDHDIGILLFAGTNACTVRSAQYNALITNRLSWAGKAKLYRGEL